MSERLVTWLVRIAWAVLPLTTGPLLDAAVDGRSGAVRTTITLGAWLLWAIGLLATLVPHPLALTALRTIAPGAVAAAILATFTAADASPVAVGFAVASAALGASLAMVPEFAAWSVTGAAYPGERRLPLRVPGPLLLGPLPLAWAATVGLPATAALLLASAEWVAGAVALAASAVAVPFLGRALHGLSRRWVVFVPAGLVLHDPLAIADPVLFRRQVIESLAPAPVDTDALDLTKDAPGLALQLVLREKVPLVLVRGRGRTEAGASARLLFTPTRPGAVLAEAAERRYGKTGSRID